MPASWYVLHSHPNKEDALWQHLLGKGVDVFYPRQRVHPVNPRARTIKPYFPGYMFVHVDLAETGMNFFEWMPWATGLISFSDGPAPVPDNLIEAIRQRVGEIAAAGGELFDGLRPGDKVVIQSNAFEGYEAIFDARVKGTERVRILLQLLGGRSVPMELPAGQIHKKRSKIDIRNKP